MSTIRVLHFSDVHLEQGFEGVPRRQFLNKRAVAYLNLVLSRRGHFGDAEMKVEALARFMHEAGVHVSLGTGDYTALGTQPELDYARRVMEPLTEAPMGFVTVPGNHDIYLSDNVEDRRWEGAFGTYMKTDRPDLLVDGEGWPQVRFFGEHLAIVTVNSARPNDSVFASSGRIPEAQIEGLRRVVADEEVASRFVMLATHYAPRLASGRPDSHHHGLENADALLDALKPLSRGVICHGHVHWNYHVREPGLRLDLCCAGSTTFAGREGLWVYDVGPTEAVATPGTWNGERYVLDSSRAVTLNAE